MAEKIGRWEYTNKVAILMGTFTEKWGAKKKGIIPKDDDGKDRSRYNQQKYQFLLNAPFPISSHCCAIMKKKPSHKYAKETGRNAMTAEMAQESRLRTQNWIKNGCNMYDNKIPKSTPMAFWTEQDVLRYIKEHNIEICSVYGDIVVDEERSEQCEGQLLLTDSGIEETECTLKTTGCDRTGCMFCGYGCHLEKPGEGRFERMKETHPKIYEWIMKDTEKGGLGYKKIIDWLNENGNLNIRY